MTLMPLDEWEIVFEGCPTSANRPGLDSCFQLRMKVDSVTGSLEQGSFEAQWYFKVLPQ